MNTQDIGDAFVQLLEESGKEFGADLKQSARAVADYAAERAWHLSAAVGQPGFQEAVRAEAQAVALRAARAAVEDADEADERLIALVQGALQLAARALVAV